MGKQELGETVAQCAVRETAEETGVTVEVTGILGIYSDPGHVVYYDSNGETRQEYEVILLGHPVSGQPAANEEASAAGWFTLAELEGLDIHPTQVAAAPRLDRRRVPARRLGAVQKGVRQYVFTARHIAISRARYGVRRNLRASVAPAVL